MKSSRRIRITALAAAATVVLLGGPLSAQQRAGVASSRKGASKANRPNILFVVMDDVGIDQMQKIFRYGDAASSSTPSPTPVMDTIATGGIRFRNVWAMPECSPSRALMLTGRYPLRTRVYGALQPLDLANSQVSPYETTTPRVLKHAGYTSALFGKLHVGGAHNYPDGSQSPAIFGFDYFHGPMGGTTAGGKPEPIDTTAGGVAPEGTYGCGFVPNSEVDRVNGADSGACYFADGRCAAISPSEAEPHPGRACLEQGGLFVPEAECQEDPPSGLDFERANAYYVWSLGETGADGVIRQGDLKDPRSRTYWPTEITTAAIDWINARRDGPWMATVSYPSIHSPYQPAPRSLAPSHGDLAATPCTDSQAQTLSAQMLQAMDTEIGRLLVETGLASRERNGGLHYTPEASNTMIVILGDNGSYGPAVKEPFDPSRAKGTAFQTGVWVPLIVAGPLVQAPDRDVDAMVNQADVFELFAEIAGVDVRKIVPSSRALDSVSMLPYLTQPRRPGLRRYNFTQTGTNLTANGERPGPCVLPMALTDFSDSTCVQLMIDEESCEGEGGTWFGEEYGSCCELIKANPGLNLQSRWIAQEAVRNDGFKLVRTTYENCFAQDPQDPDVSEYTLHRIDQGTFPTLDTEWTNLITHPRDPVEGLTAEQAVNYRLLRREMDRMLTSEVECPGDGNKDGVVDEEDIANWSSFQGKGSSWYDFPRPNEDGVYVYDGLTDEKDLQVILEHLGKCPQR